MTDLCLCQYNISHSMLNTLAKVPFFSPRSVFRPLSIESDRIQIQHSLIKQKHMASSKNYGGSLGLGMAGYLGSIDTI